METENGPATLKLMHTSIFSIVNVFLNLIFICFDIVDEDAEGKRLLASLSNN